MKLAILISGRGSNMIALADYAAQEDVPCDIVCVIADQADAGGLKAAAERGIPAMAIPRLSGEPKSDHEARIIAAIEQAGAECVFLAGYMRLLSSSFCTRFQNKLFNIHPSLLPRHKGLDTHQRALDAGDKTHGCSVHLVDPGMDEGLVLAQRTVSVMDGDTAASLAERVLREEHQLYPALLGALATGLLTITDGQPQMDIGSLPGKIAGVSQRWPI